MRSYTLSVLLIMLASLTGLADNDTLRVGVLHDVTTTNIHRSLDTITSSILGNVVETLVRYKHEGFTIEPSLAVSWEQDSAFKVWTYKLRTDVLFHNGEPLKADDVVYSFRDLPNFPAEVKALDTHTVQFILQDPNAKFNDLISHPSRGITPRSVPAESGRVIGTGPFTFKSRTPGKIITLESNPKWWDGRTGVSTVEFHIYATENELINALINQDIDLAEWLTGDAVLRLNKQPHLHVSSTLGNNVGFLSMNVEKPPFNDKELRVAVSEGLNVVDLTRRFFSAGTGAPATTFVPPPLFKHVPSRRPYEPQKAKGIVSKVRLDPQKPLVLLETWAQRPYMPRPHDIAVAVKESLEEIGVPVKIEIDPSHYFDRIRDGAFDLCLSGWIGDSADPVEFVAANFHTEYINYQNVPRWSNSEFDRLINESRVERGLKFKQLFRQALLLIEEDVPVVPLFWGAQSAAWNRRVRGYQVHPSNHMMLWDVRVSTGPTK